MTYSYRRLLAAALFALIMAGFSSTSTSHAAAPGCNPAWPVVEHHAGGQLVAAPRNGLPVACARETGYASSESSLAVTNAGTLIYSPAQTENTMARSSDAGATWSLTYPADEQPTSFWNTTDPFVIADRRTGRAFWSHATGPVRNETALPNGAGFWLAAASGFQVYTSKDDGRSWSTADYQTAPTGDWEKLSVGPPPPASTGAAQPTGYADMVYLCANSPVEVAGPGRLCYKSLDGGATFQIAGYMSPTQSQPADVCSPLNFNPSVVDSRGNTYTPVECQLSAYVAVSHDEGASYTWTAMHDPPVATAPDAANLQLAVDDADTLYAAWTANGLIYMEISRDHARTWSKPLMIAAPGVGNVQRPTLAAGAPGHVAVTYYASPDPNAQFFNAYITQTADALATQPRFVSGVINDPAHPIFHDYAGNGSSPRADFIGGAYDHSGTRFWAGVVKQFGPPDANNHLTTTGYVGHLAPRR